MEFSQYRILAEDQCGQQTEKHGEETSWSVPIESKQSTHLCMEEELIGSCCSDMGRWMKDPYKACGKWPLAEKQVNWCSMSI